MAKPYDSDDEEKPLDPALERVQARLKRMMTISLGTLGIGVLAVFVAILFRVSRMSSPADVPADAWQSIVQIETQGRIVDTSVSGDRVAITVEGAQGRVIEVHHLPTGKLIGRAALIAP